MKRTILLILAITILCTSIVPTYAQRRRAKAKQTKQTQQQIDRERKVQAEVDMLLRQRFTFAQRATIEGVIEKLWRDCYVYKVTGEMGRVGNEFFTDWNLDAIETMLRFLPKGYLEIAIRSCMGALLDAYLLHQAYFTIKEISTDDLLRISRKYGLENVPHYQHIGRIMAEANGYGIIALDIARRAGMEVSPP